MLTRHDVVAEARSWIGTPYRHQGRLKGVGVDCLGLIVGVARALGLADKDADGYGAIPSDNRLRAALEAEMDRVPTGSLREADVLLIAWKRWPAHLAIATETAPAIRIVDALRTVGRCCEYRAPEEWFAAAPGGGPRLVGVYRFRGVA
jgi:NlpC/P60 family putative phage cell wall peptidase